MKYSYLLFLSLCTFWIFGQAPRTINYQGVARDVTGAPITSTVIGLQFNISTPGNPNFHNEVQSSVPVNAMGLFSTKIGQATQLPLSGWENPPAVLTVSISINGAPFAALGSQTLSSVPFALYAQSAPIPSLQIIGGNLSLIGGNTVTLPAAVTYTSGSGIIVSGSVISNVAPDQTVTISNGSNVNVSGTYPNFTIDATPTLSLIGDQLLISGGNVITLPQAPTYTSGNGISIISGSIITNTAPNQSVSVTGAGVSGSYPNYVITSPPVTTISAGNSNISVSGSPPNYTISSSPTLALSSNSLSISNGNTVVLPVAPVPTISGSGIAVVSPTTGNNFVVTVPTPSFTAIGSATVSGSYPSYTLSAPTLTPSWFLQGNAGTSTLTNFIGTTDNVPLSIRVNNVRSGFIDHINQVSFFGYQSGISNNGATQNTGIGYRALFANTTGFHNAAAGHRALQNNSTGSYNTAFGHDALISNSTASLNTAIGDAALYTNNGPANTAAGTQALYSNSTGSYNVAVGTYAMNANSTGSSNNALGFAALYNMGTGMNNTSMGHYSSFANLNGSSNSVFGHVALYSSTTGSFNTVVGSYAGYTNTVGNGNVFIGYTAGYFEAGSNKLYISNSATTPLIYGDFATARIGLGNTTPSAKLDLQNQATGVTAFSAINSSSANAYGGVFQINNPNNGLNALWASTNGSGAAIYGLNNYTGVNSLREGINVTAVGGGAGGTTNRAAYFSASNATNNYAAIFDQGRVGINTTAPTQPLHVNGAVRISDGSEASGKVLTSDASGVASWQNKNTVLTSVAAPGCQMVGTVGMTPVQLGPVLANFSKTNAATKVEITFQTFINVFDLNTANGVIYELRVDGLPASNNAGKTVYFKPNGGSFNAFANDQVTLRAIFPSLATGAHTISLYVYTLSGSANSVYYDPGCWGTSNVTIVEFW